MLFRKVHMHQTDELKCSSLLIFKEHWFSKCISDISAALARVEGCSVKAQEMSSKQFLLWDYDRLSINPGVIKQVLFGDIRLSYTPANKQQHVGTGITADEHAAFMCNYVIYYVMQPATTLPKHFLIEKKRFSYVDDEK